jgi:hypothetical protein
LRSGVITNQRLYNGIRDRGVRDPAVSAVESRVAEAIEWEGCGRSTMTAASTVAGIASSNALCAASAVVAAPRMCVSAACNRMVAVVACRTRRISRSAAASRFFLLRPTWDSLDFYSLVTLLLTGEASFTPPFTSLLHHSFISSITSLSALGEGWPRRRVGHSPERVRADCRQDIVICGSTSPTDDNVMTSLYVSLRRSRWTDPRADTAPTERTQTACASSCMETGWRAFSVCACACTRAGDACTRGLAHEGG